MKSSSLALLTLASAAGTASAGVGRPRLSINVRDGSFSDGFDSIDPSVQWSATGSGPSDSFDYEIGVDLSVRPTGDVASLAKSAYGTVTKEVGGWGLSARADVDLAAEEVDGADLSLGAKNGDWGLGLKFMGTTGTSNSLDKIEVNKGFDDVLGGKLTVNPRFNLAASKADVVLGYDTDSTGVQIVASGEGQKITVSQKVLDSNVISPSVTTGGDVALQWKKDLGDGSSVVTTVKPGDSVGVKWTDGEWVANIDAPLDGLSLENVNVSVKRKVDLM